METWYEFEEILSTIYHFFEAGFDDEDFQECWLSRFMEDNAHEINAIRYLIEEEEEEDDKTIILDHREIIECE